MKSKQTKSKRPVFVYEVSPALWNLFATRFLGLEEEDNRRLFFDGSRGHIVESFCLLLEWLGCAERKGARTETLWRDGDGEWHAPSPDQFRKSRHVQVIPWHETERLTNWTSSCN